MSRLFQAAALFVVLVLFFQCDPSFRAWERETLGKAFRESRAPVLPLRAVRQDDDDETTIAPTPRPDPFAGDSPNTPITSKDAQFPGPGWYRVKLWRAWFPENMFQCLDTSYRHIATEDEWWDMYWGTWERNVGPVVAADARMYTTDGVRLEQPPEDEELAAAGD